MLAFVHGVDGVVVVVVVVDAVLFGEKVEVGAVVVVVNIVGEEVVLGGVVESYASEEVVVYGVALYGVVVVCGEIQAVFVVVCDGVGLYVVV